MKKTTGTILGISVAALAGTGVGYLVASLLAKKAAGLPQEFAQVANRLRFKDTDANTYLNGPVYLNGGIEANGFEYRNVGYGLANGIPDDIIVNIAKNIEQKSFIVNIVKLADDQIEVYLDGTLKDTFPSHAGSTANTLLLAKVWFGV
jgi:hypothetical protein